MPSVSSIRRPIIRDHVIDFGDDVQVTFRFDRNKITDAWIQEWTRLEGEENVGAINLVLADLIDEWDILEDDETACPPTAENIGRLFSLADKGTIVRELMTATVPTDAEGKASSAPSNTPPSSSGPQPPMSPNGLTASSSAAPLASPSPT